MAHYRLDDNQVQPIRMHLRLKSPPHTHYELIALSKYLLNSPNQI